MVELFLNWINTFIYYKVVTSTLLCVFVVWQTWIGPTLTVPPLCPRAMHLPLTCFRLSVSMDCLKYITLGHEHANIPTRDVWP